jgi:hypothetical protein
MKRRTKANGPLGVARENACGYCHLHRVTLSVKQLRGRECLRKQCRHLVPWKQHPYWEQRAREKERKEQRKLEKKRGDDDALLSISAPADRV